MKCLITLSIPALPSGLASVTPRPPAMERAL